MSEHATTTAAADTLPHATTTAATLPHPTAPPLPLPVPASAASSRQERRAASRVMLLNGLGLLALIIIGLGAFYFWHQGYYFYSTDDAVVSAPTAQVAPPVPGSVVAVYRGQGGQIHTGDVIARLRAATGVTVAVTSPLNGTIVQEGATPGEVFAAGQPLAQVADLGGAFIMAYVEETHIKDVHPGQGVDVTVAAVSDTTFHGTVAQIQPVAASALSPLPTTDYASGNFTAVTQRVPVQISLDGYQGHTLYPGTSVSVTIHIHS